MLLQFFGLFTKFSILPNNVGSMQVGHGFDAVVIFIKGDGYFFLIIGFEVLDNGVLVVAIFVKLFILRLHIQYFVVCVSWFFCSTRIFLLRSNINIESKGYGGGGGVWAEFCLLLVCSGEGSVLSGSPGGGTGDLLFLPLCVLTDPSLVLGGVGMYLG